MTEKKRKLQYVTLLWEELPETIHVLVIPRSAIEKGDIRMHKACHCNYINSAAHVTEFAKPKEIDRSLVLLLNMLLNPNETWINKAYIDEQADQLGMTKSEFKGYLGRWYEFRIDQGKPMTLPRSKMYRSGMLT